MLFGAKVVFTCGTESGMAKYQGLSTVRNLGKIVLQCSCRRSGLPYSNRLFIAAGNSYLG